MLPLSKRNQLQVTELPGISPIRQPPEVLSATVPREWRRHRSLDEAQAKRSKAKGHGALDARGTEP